MGACFIKGEACTHGHDAERRKEGWRWRYAVTRGARRAAPRPAGTVAGGRAGECEGGWGKGEARAPGGGWGAGRERG